MDAVPALLVDAAEPDPVPAGTLDPTTPVPVALTVGNALREPVSVADAGMLENGSELGVALGPVGERPAVEKI